ncbi:N-acetylmuramoyl-L-alanine amidase [Phormidium tenue FACHB-886]|nr:N-acetylmuramoyl-L-alanine amidase [Phormidium tenue FACHB-886]
MLVLVVGGIQAITRVNLIDIPPVSAQAEDRPAQRELAFPPLPDLQEFPDPLITEWRQIPYPTASSSRVQTAITTSGINAPRQEIAWADPSNYGDRFVKDINGRAVHNDPLVVLHETVWSADSALNTFQTPHPNEDDQVSYHSLIRRDGTVIYVVPPEKRAFGAGNSAFKGKNGVEAVKTHRLYPPSVNNFAYHISLESPSDGSNSSSTHSGYTDEQYRSLAWLVAQTQIPDERVVTHRGVDRSGSRIDPRSFDGRKFYDLLHQYPRPGLASR